MYICICNGVTDSQIRQSVRENGCRRVRHLRKTLGACNQCGKCASAAKQVIEDCLDEQRIDAPVLGPAPALNFS